MVPPRGLLFYNAMLMLHHIIRSNSYELRQWKPDSFCKVDMVFLNRKISFSNHQLSSSYLRLNQRTVKTEKTVFFAKLTWSFWNRKVSFSNHQLPRSYLQLNQRTVTNGSHNTSGIFIKDVIFGTTYLHKFLPCNFQPTLKLDIFFRLYTTFRGLPAHLLQDMKTVVKTLFF